ncbi:MAG: DUF3899 domain-containing protein [Defluviitaleaceae bacterium]|nr:DUF3899 domain-containing protein [Defluviitaleaceae bacterium]
MNKQRKLLREERSPLKKIIIGSTITAVIAAVFVLLIINSRGIFREDDFNVVARIMSDGLFIVGGLSLCFGLLTITTFFGAFDMLAFSMKTFFYKMRFIPFLNPQNAPTSFYEYKQKKIENGKKPAWNLIIVGVLFVSAAAIFASLYESYVSQII